MIFDEVYKEYFSELRRFGRQLNVSVEKCEELTQETFLRFYMELKKDVVFENPRAWLYKVFLNLFKTNFISNRHEYANKEIEKNAEEQTIDLHEEFTKNEKKRIVFEMLDQLTKRENV